MKKYIFFSIFFIVLTTFLLITAAPTYAFWPFDTGNSQVQGAQTDGGFFGLMQNMMRRFGQSGSFPHTSQQVEENITSPFQSQGAPNGATGSRGMMDPESRLNQAIQNGKITQAQATEIRTRVAAIQAKREELMKLETSLRSWMMENNIPPGIIGPQQMMQGQGNMMPPTQRGYRTTPPTKLNSNQLDGTYQSPGQYGNTANPTQY